MEPSLEGACGIDAIQAFDVSDYDCRIAGEVLDLDPTPAFPTPRRSEEPIDMLNLASMPLIRHCCTQGWIWRNRLGAGRRLHRLWNRRAVDLEKQHSILENKGPARVSPFLIPMQILNMASGLFSMYYGLKGPNVATCSACATATHALGEAWRTLKMGDAKVMFAGGAEAAVTPVGIGGFSAMKAMSTRNDEPKRASRPFDADRAGFVMGEGAAVLVLEELEHAKARGAEIFGELVGYGNTADAHHMTSPAPDGEGAARCMNMALRSAGLAPEAISYINAHGTSTPQGDICETAAIKTVFKDHARKLCVSSTKGATGHMLGAAGAIEMTVCTMALKDQKVPPTINYETPDPACDLDYVPNKARETPVEAIMNNSFGFGGHNACVVAQRFKD